MRKKSAGSIRYRKVHREIPATAAGINLNDRRPRGVPKRLIIKMILRQRYVLRLNKTLQLQNQEPHLAGDTFRRITIILLISIQCTLTLLHIIGGIPRNVNQTGFYEN